MHKKRFWNIIQFLFKEGGMPGNIWAWCEKYMPDGLHPNDAGHVLIANKLQKFLENL